LQGMPGLAKTMLVSTMASLIDLSFRRVQFTPDLMPGDITGTEVLQEDQTTGKRVFQFIEGPLFGNVILADEINRTPPKTQSALLEAMQERQLTVCGKTYKLPDPFFVLATQNPVETEGTYPLPEAQLDRFLLKIHVKYPSRVEELEIARRQTTASGPKLFWILTTCMRCSPLFAMSWSPTMSTKRRSIWFEEPGLTKVRWQLTCKVWFNGVQGRERPSPCCWRQRLARC